MGSVSKETTPPSPFQREYVSVEPQFLCNILWQESPFTSASPSQHLCDPVGSTDEGMRLGTRNRCPRCHTAYQSRFYAKKQNRV